MTLNQPVIDASHGPIWTTGTFLGSRYKATGTPGTPASTAWPANNDAYAVPFLVAFPTTFVEAFFISGTTPGTANFDLGIYDDTFTKIISLGATACVNTSDTVMPAGGAALSIPTTLKRGRYFLAMSAAATTITVRASAPANQTIRLLGAYKMATAHPLPTTFVPASMGTSTFLPTLGLTTATNAIL